MFHTHSNLMMKNSIIHSIQTIRMNREDAEPGIRKKEKESEDENDNDNKNGIGIGAA